MQTILDLWLIDIDLEAFDRIKDKCFHCGIQYLTWFNPLMKKGQYVSQCPYCGFGLFPPFYGFPEITYYTKIVFSHEICSKCNKYKIELEGFEIYYDEREQFPDYLARKVRYLYCPYCGELTGHSESAFEPPQYFPKPIIPLKAPSSIKKRKVWLELKIGELYEER